MTQLKQNGPNSVLTGFRNEVIMTNWFLFLYSWDVVLSAPKLIILFVHTFAYFIGAAVKRTKIFIRQ